MDKIKYARSVIQHSLKVVNLLNTVSYVINAGMGVE